MKDSKLNKEQRLNQGRWSIEEQTRFLKALKLFGKDWSMIEMYIGTRDVKNIRSHAQKFAVKLEKFLELENGNGSQSHQSCQQFSLIFDLHLQRSQSG